MSYVSHLYARLPIVAQHAAVSAFGFYWNRLRFGPGYDQAASEYRRREQLNQTDWNDYVRTRTREVLTIASERVPYYQTSWTRAEHAAARAGSLGNLPLTAKDPLRRDPQSFVRVDMPHVKRLAFHTSGSTGTPIASIWTVRELRDSLALREVRSANWAGTSFRRPRATFSGRIVVPDPNSQGPFHRFNIVERQAYLSAFHLRPNTAAQYVDALWRHQIEWLTGYAVSYYLLAKFILLNQINVPPLRAVVTTSEKVTPEMRTVMEAAYKCRVYEEYSTVENAVFASECEEGRLHVSEDAGVLEILRPDGSACDPNEDGEVVATCLMRTLQPVVRFRLGDMAAWDPDPCPCGRTMRVLKEVVGRLEDVIIGQDGRQLVRFHGIFSDQSSVSEGQIIQETLDRILVKVVPIDEFGPRDAAEIIARVKQRVGPSIDVTVETVPSIPKNKSGKFQAVVSLLRSQSNAV